MLTISKMAGTAAGCTILIAVGVLGCRPADLLRVSPPSGVTPTGALQNQTGAESELAGQRAEMFEALATNAGLFELSGLLADEFTSAGLSGGGSYYAALDARETSASLAGNTPWSNLLKARSGLQLAVLDLQQYEPASGQSKIGEAYALIGYVELLIAEDYCAGTPLSSVTPVGGFSYGMPLTTDSLLATASQSFDSAAAYAGSDPSIQALAAVGAARTLVDQGQYAAAASLTATVPTAFVYNVEMGTSRAAGNAVNLFNMWYEGSVYGSFYKTFVVADQEGNNGLSFVTAQDPRLLLDSSKGTTSDNKSWYLPLKFEANLADIPLATGIEARLIEAEAALQTHDTITWLTDLNTLRANGGVAGLASLASPGTDSGRVSLHFRERAFWLFGTGTRLGDLRRMVRQYTRPAEQVYPTGNYAPNASGDLSPPIPAYGTDVAITIPTLQSIQSGQTTETNPNYKGCITSTTTP